MAKAQENKEKKFDIHASIVFKLGEDLISDEVQALVELIKNAYDADSNSVTVIIETDKKNDIKNTRYQNANGYILIKDYGFGMTEKAIERGWLTVSNSRKREMKAKRETTPNGRTPLGDKGLGRLGSQRLGDNVEIFTKPHEENYDYHVAFSWNDFTDTETLSKVPVYYMKNPSGRESETTILISELKRPEALRDEKYKEDIQKELSRMLSPYKEIRGFAVDITIDGQEIDLAAISEDVLNSSHLRYVIKFDEKKIKVKGFAKLGYFRPPHDSTDKYLFRSLVEKDGGQEFLKFLFEIEKAKTYNLKKSDNPAWLVEYSREISFKDIPKLELIKGKRVNPGRFEGRVDSFDLGAEEGRRQSVFDQISEYRDYIKELSGIRVYRDGFGIRVDRDWLGLGKQATSGRSYYGLRLNNVLGYIALSARDNINLEETTDREGFKINSYYNNFYKILEEFIRFTEDGQQFLRRSWLKFRKKHQEKVAKIKGPTNTPESLSKKVKESVGKSKAFKSSLEEVQKILSKKSGMAKKTIALISGRPSVKTGDVKLLTNLVQELEEAIKDAQDELTRLKSYLDEVGEISHLETLIENHIKKIKEQLEEVYETISLGLTAEALSHEIYNVIDHLEKMADKVNTYINKQSQKDSKIVSFVEYVRTSANALRKQLAHLAPSLRYVREKKERIDVALFCHDIADDYYNEHLNKKNIKLKVETSKKGNFSIYINRGKLNQVLDNLLRNSEYWLREDIRVGNIKRGLITITISNPFIRISDNGSGVLPLVEATLFEPFISMKSLGEGRGLGLFVVRQLLNSESATISLLPERNRRQRQYIFEIDFSGSLDEG